MPRKSRRGLPPPRIHTTLRNRTRTPSAFWVALFLHLFLALLFSVYLVTVTEQGRQTPTFEVEWVLEDAEKQKRQKRPPRRVQPKTVVKEEATPEWERMESPRPLAILPGSRPIVTAANQFLPTISTTIPTVDTIADVRIGADALSARVGTPNRPTPGQGNPSSVQRPQGRGTGRNIADSTGTSDVSLSPGDSRGSGAESGRPKPSLKSPFANALERIGESIAQGSPNSKPDIAFVVDTSGSMENNIRQVADSLFELTAPLEARNMDYQLTVIEFNETSKGTQVQTRGWTKDAQYLRQRMNGLAVLGNERSLDALVQTLEMTRFRPDGDRHLVLVTDEPASTKWSDPQEVRSRIFASALRDVVHVQVLGFNEAFQRQLAQRTGGLFQVIPGGQASAGETESPASSEYLLGATELSTAFRLIAGDILRFGSSEDMKRGGTLDVAVFVDYSKSMGGRKNAVMNGISTLVKALEVGGFNYAVSIVRFGDTVRMSGSGFSGIAVSPWLTSAESLQEHLAYPYSGEEYQLDGVADGLKALKFRNGAKRVAIVVTDEPSSGRKVSADAFLNALDSAGIRLYAVCPFNPVSLQGVTPVSARASTGLDALVRGAVSSGGRVQPMPRPLQRRDPTQ